MKDHSMAIKVSVIEDNASRNVALTVDNAPDIPHEFTTLRSTLRPASMEVFYAASNGVWQIVQIKVSGRPVMQDGSVSMASSRRNHARFLSFGADGEGKTPPWVLEFAAKYSDPNDLPTRKR
jgi:hypothetical protein